jgi:hypothetical protein
MENGLVSMAQQFSGLPMDSLIGAPLKAAAEANSMMAVTFTKFMLDNCFAKVSVKVQPLEKGAPASAPGVTPIVPEKVGHPEIPEHDEYRPVMVVMSLTRAVLTPGSAGSAGDQTVTPVVPAVPAQPAIVQNFTTAFNLPLLTIMPLNSLAVETADINFEMEVKSSFSEEQNDTKEKQVKAEASFEAKVGYGPFSASVKGSASYDQKDTSTHNTHYQKSNSAKYTVNVHAGQLPLPQGVTTIIEAFASAIQPITLN